MMMLVTMGAPVLLLPHDWIMVRHIEKNKVRDAVQALSFI